MIARLARRYLQAANIAGKPALVRASAQALFDALWQAGYRPGQPAPDPSPTLPLE